jgi:hypothetical protein
MAKQRKQKQKEHRLSGSNLVHEILKLESNSCCGADRHCRSLGRGTFERTFIEISELNRRLTTVDE